MVKQKNKVLADVTEKHKIGDLSETYLSKIDKWLWTEWTVLC
jgi:hypothetical protein